MKAIIITIGDELLIGQTIDTNSAWIAQQLNNRGIDVIKRIAIADDKTAIIQSLDEAVGRYDYIFITGGLGPTADDITKPVLCEYFNGKLVVNEQVLSHLHQIFTERKRPLIERNLKQAEVPDVCKILFNRIGTAPGMWFEKNDSKIISMPGVPFEMQSIMEESVMPLLDEAKSDEIIYHKTLILVGVGESYIAEKIADIEQGLPANIHLAYLPSPGILKLRLTAKSKNDLTKEVNQQATLIQQRLGNIVAADKDISLEEIVVSLLKEKGLMLALAESCTGGYISHKITNIPGASKVFKGSVVSYDNNIKQSLLSVSDEVLQTEGAVSEATVVQMAKKVREMMQADIGITVSGILGPDGGTPEKPVGTVWIGIADKNSTDAQKFHFFYDRLRNKELAANAALEMVRKRILY